MAAQGILCFYINSTVGEQWTLFLLSAHENLFLNSTSRYWYDCNSVVLRTAVGWANSENYLCLFWISHWTTSVPQDHTAEDSWTPRGTRQKLLAPSSKWTRFHYLCRHLKCKGNKKIQISDTFMNLDIFILYVYTYSFQIWGGKRGRPWGSPSASLDTLHWLSV